MLVSHGYAIFAFTSRFKFFTIYMHGRFCTCDENVGVGAQSTLGGHHIFARKICIKNQQNARILHDSCPKNYQNTRIFMIFALKIYKIPEFYMIFAPKCPNFT